MPVAGRGTKRGRDLDLEKVGDKFTSMSGYYFLDHYPGDSDSGYNTGELDSPNSKRCRLSLQNDELPFGLDGSNDLRNNDSTVGTVTKSGRKSKPSARAANRQIVEAKRDVPGSTAKTPHQPRPKVRKQPEKKAEQKIENPEKKAEKKPVKKTEKPKKPRQPAKRAKKPANTETEFRASPPPANQRIIDISSESELEEIPPNYHGDPHLHYGTINPSSHPQEDAFHSRPAVRLPIPDHIKALLVDDWENVTKNLSLVPLPSPHPVSEILTAYLEEEKVRRRVGSVEYDLLEEVVAGLREYFDHTLGRILLYRFEREQYFQVRKKGEIGEAGWIDKPASEIYGAEHLCRLFGMFHPIHPTHSKISSPSPSHFPATNLFFLPSFLSFFLSFFLGKGVTRNGERSDIFIFADKKEVSLPELIAQTNMDTQSVNRLREELAKITSWLGKNSARFFTAEYEAATPEYIEKARGAE